MLRQLFHNLAPFVSGLRRQAIGIAILAAFAGAVESVALLITVRLAMVTSGSGSEAVELPIVDHALSTGQAVAIAIGCAIGALVSHIVIARRSAALGSAVLRSTRLDMIGSYLRAGWPTQATQREGALQEAVTTLSMHTAWLAELAVGSSAQVIMLTIFLTAALITDVVTTLAVFAAGAVIVLGLRPISKLNLRRSVEFVEANSHFAEEVAAVTSTTMELRVFGVQHAALDHLSDLTDSVGAKHTRTRFVTMAASGLLRDLAILLLAGVIGVLSLIGRESMEGLGVAIVLVVRSLASAQALNTATHGMIQASPSLAAIIDRIAELQAGTVPSGTAGVHDLDAVRFDRVGYRYNDEATALADISFDISHGDAIGVVGPSGGGKSTLLQILLRLRPPTEGKVLVNGIDYREYRDDDWARILAFVPQEPTLFEGTIAANIAYHRTFPLEAVHQAAREANVYDEIMALPEGFNTKLGPRGSGLSGGQKQRVAIARALIGRPQLLVMDEPSSALDPGSERLLHETLLRLKGQTTSIIVAHRHQTIESCDRLLLIEGGRLTRIGRPDDMLNHDGSLRQFDTIADG